MVRLAFLCTSGLLGILIGLLSPALAKDLGVYGQVFEIKENDLLKEIESKLSYLQKEGVLAEIQEQQAQKARETTTRPQAVEGLKRATKPRTWLHDPSLLIVKTIKDHQGKVIAKAGTRINPLDTVPFRNPFVFLDSDDPEQVQWLKETFSLDEASCKVILVKGAPLDMAEAFKRPIYFDQDGRLIRYFKIQAVPAIVRQEDKKLRVEEISINEIKKPLKVSQNREQQTAADHQGSGQERHVGSHSSSIFLNKTQNTRLPVRKQQTPLQERIKP